jgi:arginine:agmatine antiporter
MTSTGGAKKLGAFLATMLVAGNMIGSGVYLLPASLGAVGSISVLGWLIAIFGAALLGGSFSALTILRPKGTGLIVHVREVFGPGAAFIWGILYWGACWTGNVAIALAVTGYLGYFLPDVAAQPGSTIATVGVLWLFTAANIIGPRFVARLEGGTLLLGLAPVLLIALGGWFYFDPALFLASWNVTGKSAFEAVPQSVVMVFWAFLGVECANIVAPLVKNPTRDVPIATLGGLSIAALVYMSACAAIFGILPASDLAASSAPFADAAKPLVGASLAAVVALCAMIKASGTVGGWILVSAETWGTDEVLGLLLRRPAKRRNGGPSVANLLFNGLLMSVAAVATASPNLARQFTVVADVSVILCMFLYSAACLALIKLSGERSPRWRLGARVLAVGAILFCGWVASVSETELLLWSMVSIAVVIVAYLMLAWWRKSALGLRGKEEIAGK